MATVQIRRRGNGKIIFEHTCEGNSVKVTLEHGVETGIYFADADLDGARLDGASLDGARLVGARLVGASLVGARLDVRVPPTGSHDFIAEILLRENHKYSREVAGIVLISRDWCWADFLNYFSKSKIAWAKQVLCSKWSVFEKKFGVK
ncbi:MAG: pentapeptide repeat-containing protein [Candidatus Omnitrophica bacterium]|nr:pentapeptide repeat-containing protein [Candidatus Omnitrophota bacterium]